MNVNDRTLRRLTSLQESASTARVLNLLSAHRKLGDDPALAQAPFFRNRLLNHSIIVKHRVRPHEFELFSGLRPNTIKILAPIDGSDLKLGARSLMLGQKDFDQAAGDIFGDDLKFGSPDRQVLDLIDELPSLDPFLVREHLNRNGFQPARGYFAISDADVQRMYDYVRGEVMALVAMSFNDGAAGPHAVRLVEKLLSNAPDSGFEPLKDTLKLNDREYLDGVFSWRGFLYYKWVLADAAPAISEVLKAIGAVQPRGPKDVEASAYLPAARQRLQAAIVRTCDSVRKMLDVYDRAYASLTQDGKPLAFRDFLLSAPGMFMSLGEQLGAIQHVVSFWRFRFTERRSALISPAELMDVFLDFEDSLAPAAGVRPNVRAG
jgi:hypothetical protein